MTGFILLALLWAACGFYTWGTAMAYWNWCNRHEWPSLNSTSRDNVGMVSAFSLLGPIGAFACALLTNFNQHGWELWEKPVTTGPQSKMGDQP